MDILMVCNWLIVMQDAKSSTLLWWSIDCSSAHVIGKVLGNANHRAVEAMVNEVIRTSFLPSGLRG